MHVNKTNFHMKGFALELALKQIKGERQLGNRLLTEFNERSSKLETIKFDSLERHNH